MLHRAMAQHSTAQHGVRRDVNPAEMRRIRLLGGKWARVSSHEYWVVECAWNIGHGRGGEGKGALRP